MRKFIILIPVFNDWESLSKLLEEIEVTVNDIENSEFYCFVINDASEIDMPSIKKPSNLKSLKVLNMKKNTGHARCLAFGIKYLVKSENFDYLISMDGDGEDRPKEIISLVQKTFEKNKTSVVAKRVKRSEGIFFKLMYNIHKFVTLCFTGKKIYFGNYSCLTFNDVKILSRETSLWSSFSGSVKKHIENLEEINSIRGVRYFGPSKMSIFKLILHSFSIIAVFRNTVFFRSVVAIILISYFDFFSGFLSNISIFLIVTFNLLIFLISKRENDQDFENSHLNLKDTNKIIH